MSEMSPAEEIFFAALEKAIPAERATYLDEACAGQPGLRGPVEKLLAAHPRVGGFLESGAATGPFHADPNNSLADASRPDVLPGTVIAGRYKLLEAIGEGGMGAVWVAEQMQPVRRKVALKLIKAGMDSKSVLARFEAERQALAVMDHPSIAKVLDGGLTETGRPFFVMEYVKGVPITEYCDATRLSVPERLNLFVQVCHAVQHAHQKGIIHRDLKPSNILVAPYDDKPVPKVIDFGLAKAIHQSLTERTLHTAHETVLGTPLYMSPEQAQLNNLDVDTRSDIYSLGVLLYELLTGTTPLEKQRFKEAVWDEIKRIIREEEAPRPSTRLSSSNTLASLAAGRQIEPERLTKLVRGELDWIVMKSLEKDRARRYETANGFAMDVQRFLAGDPVLAVPPSTTYRLRKFARKHRAGLATAAAIMLLLVAGVALSTWQAVRATNAEAAALAERDQKEQARQAEEAQRKEAETQRDRAAKAEKEAKEQAAIAQAVNDFLQKDLLAQASPDHEPDRDLKLRTLLDRAAQKIEGKFDRQPLVEASIRQTVVETYIALGLFAAAQPHLERAFDLRRSHLGEEHRSTLKSLNDLAFVLREQGKIADAVALYRRTLDLRRRALGEEDPDTVITMSELELLLERQGNPAEAELLLRKVVAVRRRVHGDEHPWTLSAMSRLMDVQQAQGKLTVADQEAARRKLLEATRRVHGDAHPVVVMNLTDLVELLWRQGKLEEAERLCRDGLETARRVLGEEHHRTLVLTIYLGELLRGRGDAAAAEPLLVKGLESSRRSVGDEHWTTLAALATLAALYRDQGKYDQAEALAAEAVRTHRRVMGEDHFGSFLVHRLATVYEAQGKYAQAEPLFAQVLDVHSRRGGSAPVGQDSPLASLGANLLRQRKFAQAEPLLRECLKTPEPMQPNVWLRFHAQCLLGWSLAGQKKYADAEPLLLAGYEGLKARKEKIPAQSKVYLAEAVERLLELYTATNKPDEVKKWQAERSKYPEVVHKPPDKK